MGPPLSPSTLRNKNLKAGAGNREEAKPSITFRRLLKPIAAGEVSRKSFYPGEGAGMP